VGRMAPVLCLLMLAACGDGAGPASPSIPSSPPPAAIAPAAPQAPPTPAPHRGYTEEVDDLLRSLESSDAQSGASSRVAPRSAAPAVIYTIPRASDAGPVHTTEIASYQENLDTCLDGRFPAFCDHDKLTSFDAARVREAEYQANQVTCIDPQWQHLCRPELLPNGTPPSPAPGTSGPVPVAP